MCSSFHYRNAWQRTLLPLTPAAEQGSAVVASVTLGKSLSSASAHNHHFTITRCLAQPILCSRLRFSGEMQGIEAHHFRSQIQPFSAWVGGKSPILLLAESKAGSLIAMRRALLLLHSSSLNDTSLRDDIAVFLPKRRGKRYQNNVLMKGWEDWNRYSEPPSRCPWQCCSTAALQWLYGKQLAAAAALRSTYPSSPVPPLCHLCPFLGLQIGSRGRSEIGRGESRARGIGTEEPTDWEASAELLGWALATTL